MSRQRLPLTLGGKRILFTGDTECTPEIKALTNIDVAFIAMNLPFTMPPQEAADCAKAFKPKAVYAYHYRQQGLDPADKNQTDFVAAMKGAVGIEVKTPFLAAPPPPASGRGDGGGVDQTPTQNRRLSNYQPWRWKWGVDILSLSGDPVCRIRRIQSLGFGSSSPFDWRKTRRSAIRAAGKRLLLIAPRRTRALQVR